MSAFMKIGNYFMKILLRSPLHRMISKNTLLISYQGRKSGIVYTTPTNFSQDGNIIRIVSFRHRVWWRNLRGGRPVTLRLRGKDVQGQADVLSNDSEVAKGLAAYLQPMPEFAKFFEIGLDENGIIKPEDLNRAVKTRVIIEVTTEE